MKVRKLSNPFGLITKPATLAALALAVYSSTAISGLAEVYAANQKPVAVPGDRRIKTFTYQPNTIFEYTGYLKVASRIDLDSKEDILSITMGDQTGWQINPVGHRLFLKPTEVGAKTNMTIITTKRIYYFVLDSKDLDKLDDADMIFAITFNYGNTDTADSAGFMDFSEQIKNDPPSETEKKKNRASFNFRYTINGTKSIQPIEVYDDGEFTYFKFRDINAEVPAIFQVTPDGNESLINFRLEDGYVVVELVASQFTLRSGQQIACIFNEKMPMEKLPKAVKQKRQDDLKPSYHFW